MGHAYLSVCPVYCPNSKETELRKSKVIAMIAQEPNLQNIIRQIYNNVMTYGRFTTDLR